MPGEDIGTDDDAGSVNVNGLGNLIIGYDEEEVAGLDTLRDLDIWTGAGTVPLTSFSKALSGSFSSSARISDSIWRLRLSQLLRALLDYPSTSEGLSKCQELPTRQVDRS